MATTSGLIQFSDGWVEVATNDQNFIIDIQSPGYDLFLIIADEEPGAFDYGHRVVSGDLMRRNGADGKAWIRTDSPTDIRYIVSTGVIQHESGMTSLFMYNDASDVSTYKKLMPSPSSGGAQTVVVSSATGTGVAQAWVTEPNSPNKTYIPIGIMHAHIHAKKTGAGNVTLSNQIYKRDVAGTETLLFTTDSTPNLTTSEVSYNLEQYNDAIVALNSTDRIVIKTVYTVASGTPTITIYFEDAYLSRVEMPFSTIAPISSDFISGTLTSASGVVTVDCSSIYTRYAITLTENVTSWVFNNLPAATHYRDIYVEVTQHASAAKSVVSPATSGKTAGGAWTVSSTLSRVEILGMRIFSTGVVHLFPSGVMG